ncbi:MAG: autotransporter-associated beta strand repeat-containing protein, partial [Thermoguttaceae bacterium]
RSADSVETATFNGVTYNLVGSSIRLHDPDTLLPIDLSLYRISDLPTGLSSLSISNSSPANGSTVTAMGYGRDRAETPTHWNSSWQEITIPPYAYTGYYWLSDRPKRWGENKVSGSGFTIELGGYGENYVIDTIFNQTGGSGNLECQATEGDSGGALFYKNSDSVWTLSGILEAVTTYYGQPSNTSVFGNKTYAIDLSYYRDQIVSAVEVFQFTGILDNPNAVIGTGWQNSQLLADGGFGNLTGYCSIPVDFNGHQFTVQSGSSNITYDGTLFGDGDLIVQGGDPNTYSISLLGSSPNTYTGATQVQSGLLVLGKTNGVAALSGSQITINSGAIVRTDAAEQINTTTALDLQGGQFNLNSYSQTIGNLSGSSGSIDLGSTFLMINQTGMTAFSGQISGAGGLNKIGAGTLTLSGSNNYSGITIVSAGILKLDNASALGTTIVGTLVESSGSLDLNGQTIGNEALMINGDGGGSGGALINSSATEAIYNGDLTLGNNSAVDTTGNITLNAAVDYGFFALTKLGDATLTLTGSQTWGDNSSAVAHSGAIAFQQTSGAATSVSAITPTLQIDADATVNVDATNNDPFTDDLDHSLHIQITNDSTSGLNFTAGISEAAGIDGTGNTTLSGNTTLYTGYINQHTLTIGPGAKVVLGLQSGMVEASMPGIDPGGGSLLSATTTDSLQNNFRSALLSSSAQGIRAVPEPGTGALLILAGMIWLGCVLWKRRIVWKI